MARTGGDASTAPIRDFAMREYSDSTIFTPTGADADWLSGRSSTGKEFALGYVSRGENQDDDPQIAEAAGSLPRMTVSLMDAGALPLKGNWVGEADRRVVHRVSGRRCPDQTTIVDSLSGKFIGQLEAPIRAQAEISPDGKMVADIWPGGTRVRESGIEKYPGVVWVRNLVSGEEISRIELSNNQGLFPPWGSEEDHFIYLRDQPRQNIFRLEVYDRESGGMLAALDDFPGPTTYSQEHVTRISGSDNVVMSTGREVLVLNGLTAKLVKRIHVADDIRFTEVVVTDKPVDTS